MRNSLFITFTPLLSEGRAGEAWEPSNKTTLVLSRRISVLKSRAISHVSVDNVSVIKVDLVNDHKLLIYIPLYQIDALSC
jgi:hypothetical protein